MNTSTSKIENDLALLEAHLQQGLQILSDLRKQIAQNGRPRKSTKGLSKQHIANLIANRMSKIKRK